MNAFITVERTISMGHRLPTYKGICSSLHGHNLRVEARVAVPQEPFLDFKTVDKALGTILEDYDHALVLFENDPWLKVLRQLNSHESDSDLYHTITPVQRFVFLSHEPTTEVVAQVIFNELRMYGFDVATVKVFETAKYSAMVAKVDGAVRRVK